MMEMNEEARTGIKSPTFLDDYYYRIHISPATFSLGAILSPIEEEFIVWNAWFVGKTCSAINEVNPSEYSLSGLTAPFDLTFLEWTTYTLTIPMEGSLEFISTVTFVFPAESVVLTITGTRVTIFSFEPLVPMQESLEWFTNIMRSKDGSEQRMIVRQVPRQIFKVEAHVNNEQLQSRLDAVLFGWQKRTWGLPIWPEWTEHTDTISVDDTVIYLDTTNADYRDDSSAIIWQSPTSYEAVKISTVAADRLNLNFPVQSDWTGKKWIMPLRVANIRAATSRPATPGGYGRVRSDFIVQDNVLLTGYTPPTTYQSLPVITASTIVEGEQDVQIAGDVGFVDYDLNKFQMYSDSDYNIVVQSHIFRKNNKADCWDFRKFFHYLYGRRGAMWVITDRNDLVQQGNIGAADISFNIDNIGLANNMGLNDIRTHLAFVFPDGTQLYEEITGIVESDANTEIISINSALGVEIQPGDCEICFMDKCRLTEDVVSFEWEEAFRLKCTINLTRIEE
jgi:hypothetical protein